MKKPIFPTTSDHETSTMVGRGQNKILEGKYSPKGLEYSSVYGNDESVINYDSAAEPNMGDASFTNINVPAGVVYLGPMKNIHVVSGEVVGNIK